MQRYTFNNTHVCNAMDALDNFKQCEHLRAHVRACMRDLMYSQTCWNVVVVASMTVVVVVVCERALRACVRACAHVPVWFMGLLFGGFTVWHRMRVHTHTACIQSHMHCVINRTKNRKQESAAPAEG